MAGPSCRRACLPWRLRPPLPRSQLSGQPGVVGLEASDQLGVLIPIGLDRAALPVCPCGPARTCAAPVDEGGDVVAFGGDRGDTAATLSRWPRELVGDRPSGPLPTPKSTNRDGLPFGDTRGLAGGVTGVAEVVNAQPALRTPKRLSPVTVRCWHGYPAGEGRGVRVPMPGPGIDAHRSSLLRRPAAATRSDVDTGGVDSELVLVYARKVLSCSCSCRVVDGSGGSRSAGSPRHIPSPGEVIQFSIKRPPDGHYVCRDTSISALVAEFLERLATGDDYDEVWRRERELMQQGLPMSVGSVTWTRDDVHAR